MKRILFALVLGLIAANGYCYMYDDFESYADSAALNAGASLYLPNNYGYGSAVATLETQNPYDGGKCVKYYRTGYPNYTLFGFNYTTLPEGKLDMSGYSILKIRFRGNPNHVSGYNLEFQVRDRVSVNITEKLYILDGAKAEDWQTIEIPITSDSKWANVGYLLFTDRKDNYGFSELYVDSIELIEKGIIVNADAGLAISEQGATCQYQLVMSGQPAANVVITATAPEGVLVSGGGNFAQSVQHTFTTANWNTPAVITVKAVDDATAGYDTQIEITHTVQSGDPYFNGAAVNSVSILRIDNDYPVSSLPVKVFLLAGQSNMQGAGSNSELVAPYTETNTNVSIYVNDRWQYLAPGMGASATRFGPEMAFARQMAGALYHDNVALIKLALGGTSLDYYWRAPDSQGENAGPLYTQFTQTITDALGYCTDYEIVGMLWQQGESDANTEARANVYEQNLTDFITAVRAYVGVPQMPFMVGQVSDSQIWPYRDIVRAAQQAVADSMENVSLVSADGLTILSDEMHYDTAGTLELGRRFAFSMLDTIVVEPAPALNKPVYTYGNLSVGKFYKFSAQTHAAYQDAYPCLDYSDGSMLTDESIDAWVGWYNNPVDIILDLGKTYNIDVVRLNARSETASSIYYPASMRVYVRQDESQDWQAFGDVVYPANNTGTFSQSWLTPQAQKTAARYVKYSLTGGGGNLLVSEIEVYGDVWNQWRNCPEYGFYNGSFPVEYHGYLDISRHETMTQNKLAMVLWYHELNPAYSGSNFSHISGLYNHKSGLGKNTIDYRYLTIGWLPKNSTAADVAQGGGGYDAHFRQWFADSINEQYRRGCTDPIWLRPMNEMNGAWAFPGNTSTPGSQWGGDPINFRRAWRRIYNIAEQAGAADKHIFLWAPNGISFPSASWNLPDKYYPGDQYVDWIGLSLYPQSTIPYPENILHGTAGAGAFDFVNNWTHKPLMISEGAWKKDLDRCDGIKWINQWFDMKNIPRLKAAVWFHFQKDPANLLESGKSDMAFYDEDEIRVFRYRASKASSIKELASGKMDFDENGTVDLGDYAVVAAGWLIDNSQRYVYTEYDGLAVLEAENYSFISDGSDSMQQAAWQNLSGGNAIGSYMQALPDGGMSSTDYADCPALGYQVFFENVGNYYLHLRASAPVAESRKFYVLLNGEYAGQFNAKIFFNFSWENTGVVLSIPKSGIYTVAVAAADDGVKLDRLLLTNNQTYSSAVEPVETPKWPGPFMLGDFNVDGRIDLADMSVFLDLWLR